MNMPQPVNAPSTPDLGIRVIYMLVFGVVFWLICWILAATTLVQLQQKASGAARIVVDVVDGKSRDDVILALRGAVTR